MSGKNRAKNKQKAKRAANRRSGYSRAKLIKEIKSKIRDGEDYG